MNTIPEQPIIDSTDRTDLLIWWTDQDECEALVAINPLWSDYDATLESTPDYIHKEFCSRYGRPGRGRLWVDDQFGDVGFPWDTTKPAAKLAGKRGGIVIWAADAAHVFDLPGFLTDQRLNVVNTLDPVTEDDEDDEDPPPPHVVKAMSRIAIYAATYGKDDTGAFLRDTTIADPIAVVREWLKEWGYTFDD